MINLVLLPSISGLMDLTVEIVLQGQVISTSSSTTSGSDSSVSSVNQVVLDNVDTTDTATHPAINIPSLVTVVQNHLNAIPPPIPLKRTWTTTFRPILLSSDLVLPHAADACKAIVPYQPCLHAVLIQLWASKVEEYE